MNLAHRFDVDALATQSAFGNTDALATYIARNTDVPLKKLAKATGLTVNQIEYLFTNRSFRERLTELMTYAELSPEKERKIFQRMIGKALADDTEFKDFQAAATWVYRQGGMFKAEKAQVEHGGSVRVSFALDAPPEDRPAFTAEYVAPDPLAGVIGLRGALPQGEDVDGILDADVLYPVGVQDDEEE
jgi:hypothetical protein